MKVEAVQVEYALPREFEKTQNASSAIEGA